MDNPYDWEDISAPLTLKIESDEDRAYWDDEPSHPLCEALDQIAMMYLRHLGRMPSREEIFYGVEGVMDAMDLAELPKHAPRTNTEQKLLANRLYRGLNDAPGHKELMKQRGKLLDELKPENLERVERKLVLETKDQDNETPVIGGQILLTPGLGEDYWAYRVVLSERQAIVGFPKFSTIGIGFAVESEDWNTNLPHSCDAEEIYDHIAENKDDDSITREDCITAIKMIQEAIKASKED